MQRELAVVGAATVAGLAGLAALLAKLILQRRKGRWPMGGTPAESEIVYARYVAAFLDLPGQSAQIEHLRETAAGGSGQRERVLHGLQGTVARIINLREKFRKQFDLFSTEPPRSPLYNQLTDDQKAELERLRSVELSRWCFSDTIIGFCPLEMPAGQVSMYGVYVMLQACASVMLEAFGQELMFRGGIEVGEAAEFRDPTSGTQAHKEIYGPVLSDTYRLESQVADWPRVVIGENLLGLIRDAARQSGAATPTVANREWARVCQNMVFADIDGIHAMDYLGEAVACRWRHRAPIDFATLAKTVQEGCATIVGKHEDARRAGDAKTALKLGILRQYWESRFQYWQDNPTHQDLPGK